MLNARALTGTANVLFITLDTLRYDVAQTSWAAGKTPNLARVLPPSGWELRHTPATFTYAAHQAFFAGFLPTPTAPGRHPRLFACDFAGSETITSETAVFAAPDIVRGFAECGYRTICLGGTGFFNQQNPLGCVLPAYFDESHWRPEFGVTHQHSTEHQVRAACEILARLPPKKRFFLFINISALHQPNCIYQPGAKRDSIETQAAALEYVDCHLPPLFAALKSRVDTLCVVCSDHGTAYGEDGHTGHRLAHEVVWNVPYAEFILPKL